MSKFDFRAIASLEAQGATSLLPVIEKEILHYDILRTMSEHGFLESLCFQGGTSLRLCYGSERLSEDLDFTGGTDFTAEKMNHLKESIEDSLSSRYGLAVEVQSPKPAKHQANVNVSTWQVKVVTSPSRSDMPKQRIKIEIADIPSYTRDTIQLIENYPSISGAPILIGVQKMEETMVDKILSFPMATNIRYRDIWDLNWMDRRGINPQMALIDKKIADYSAQDYQDKLQKRITELPEIINSAGFVDQMTRFLKQSTIEQTIINSFYVSAMQNTVDRLLRLAITPSSRPKP